MNPFDMVLGIVLIGAISKMYYHYVKNKSETTRHMSELETKFKMTEGAKQGKRIENLEKRVQALETIVIEKDYELKKKFETLAKDR